MSILVIGCAYYATWFLASKSGKMKSGRSIKLRDRFSVSKDKSFCLIEVKDKVYLVAMTNQTVTLLDTLDIEAFETQTETPSARQGGFEARYEPRGFMQKTLMGIFSALKSGVGTRQTKSGEKDADPAKDLNEDGLEQVYRKMQSRRTQFRTAGDSSAEESFK
jgi:flagellar biogenesis protein FliO